jgi:ribonuclease BN (tRNA processing enzyme)
VVRESDYSLKVTVLGCSGSGFDDVLRIPCSSYLLEGPETALLLDCGFGSFDSYKAHAPTTRLDAVFLSHAHGDHVGDLDAFLGAEEVWRRRPRLIASESTLTQVFREPHALPEEALFVADNFAIDFSRTAHQIPTLAACVSIDGRRVVFSADTGPAWSVPRSFAGSLLAIIECTLERRDEGSSSFHLDAREAGWLALELFVPQAIISHVPPRESGPRRLAIARDAAPTVRFTLAKAGLEVTLA